ncbi:hypothetical protein EEB18_011635 [Sphingopyxis sp. OPL5]|uniref:hypothetical protein n=1 Tax=Sphingopyxis sp. OPL5 TaxID=2486273 RepID=UPI00164DF4F2|nr:hypothetical protein [Sphingopyxis sp. OPL5]QNO25460.1 hypothetical protein EEB18_011635 [Sphingopyxis sp. OPL5]
MTRPDLSDADARAAYRSELRGIARAPRMLGLVFVFASLGLWAWPQNGGPLVLGPLPTETWGWICLGIGWAVLLWVIVARTRHNKERLGGPDA